MEFHTTRDLFRIDPQTEDILPEDGGTLNLSFGQRPIPSFTHPDFTQSPCGDGLCFFNGTNGTNNGSLNTGNLDGTLNWWALAPAPFVIFGITGNLLVCLAIAKERRLQTVTNYFLFSLAVTDLLVSLIVMPFSILHEFRGYWSLSLGLCNFYVTSDVMMCTASIMHLCTISVDRYIGIRYPLKTRNKSKGTVAVKLLIVWSLSLVVSSPITVLGIVDEHNLIIERRCLVNNDYFIIYGSIIAFFIPLVIMVVTNVLTMQLLNEQARLCSQKKDEGCPMIRRVQGSRRLNRNPIVDKRFQTPKSNTTSNTTKTVPSTRKWAMDSNENRKLLAKNVSTAAPKVDKGPSEVQNQGDTSGFSANSSPASPRPSKFRYLIAKHNITSKAANRMLLRKDLSKENAVQTERKATKVLAVVFTIFVVSWAPFFTTNVMTVLCKWCHVDQFLFVAFVWLGYISSTLNPIIYTIFNRTFKATFIKLMVCDYSSFGRLNRTQSLKGIESSTYYHGFSSSERNHESLC
ncbi:5-hydroxytryptamine receptor 2C [Octopus bimaculoides]|uniref:G-protein coupled receptors family 1 profile domain-containing protein n=1 Tax=Octopus bimaculoides TaxID=37653 RepID=A0A0L8GAM8_OCTBM|nr:5-hydroxytryptamine receptor 2C [Octopus bimaculoides]XP_052826761.1 5-hydroxytryptamine receptor 2C [Octopus bimaculoides]|eukprot:XP_014782660.1 PREDICTED: 5-hydroxytryptamine receptor 2C-like [Octopus bimaculoides]